MKILSFYPIHRSWINSIAELFPEHTFDLAECKEISCSSIEKRLWLGNAVPFVSNVQVIGKYGLVNHEHYDLILAWQHEYSRIFSKHKWNKPVIVFIHNTGDSVPKGFKGQVVFNTYYSAEQAGMPTASVYLGVRKASELGKWTGEKAKGCVGNFDLLGSRLQMISQSELMKLLSEKLIEEIRGDIGWSDFIGLRRKLRFNLEIIKRTNCNSFLESMRMGQPCIVPDVRDYNKFIINGDNGFLYRSFKEIEQIVRQLCDDLEYAREIGRKANKTIEQHIDDTKRRTILEEVFKKALGG